jgi:hypothetical protein
VNTSTPTKVSTTEIITTHFHVPTETLPICDKYYILYWQARFLYTQLLRSPRILREGIAYVPVLQESLSLQEIGSNPESQYRLSFRRIRGHKTGYVIIRRSVAVSVKESVKESK